MSMSMSMSNTLLNKKFSEECVGLCEEMGLQPISELIIIIIMEKTEAGHQWPLYPRNTFGIITLNYIQLY